MIHGEQLQSFQKKKLENENEKLMSDKLIYKAMTKLNMTSELFATGGFRKPNVRKNLFEINYEREEGPYLQFHKLYDSTWVIATDFCSINLVEDCFDLMSQPFVKVNFVVVDVPNKKFQEMLCCHCYKVHVGRMKECDRCHNWFHEVCEDFNCKNQISKFNSKNQWFGCYYIGIHRLPYKIIGNIFVNLCLENEEMYFIIAKVCNKWRWHINKEFVEKVNFE